MQVALIDKALELVRAGKPARLAKLTPEEERPYRQLQLLTAKPVVYVCNVDEASVGRQRPLPQGGGTRQGRGRRLRRHLGQDRGGAGRARAGGARRISGSSWDCASPASTR